MYVYTAIIYTWLRNTYTVIFVSITHTCSTIYHSRVLYWAWKPDREARRFLGYILLYG